MRTIAFMCLLLLSGVAGAQVQVGGEDTVSGLPQDEAVVYGGTTSDGNCFVITRPAGEDPDAVTHAKVYDGNCSEPLKEWNAGQPMKFRDGGTLAFSFNLHPTPRGPDFDVIVISPRRDVGIKYKNKPADLKEFKKAIP